MIFMKLSWKNVIRVVMEFIIKINKRIIRSTIIDIIMAIINDIVMKSSFHSPSNSSLKSSLNYDGICHQNHQRNNHRNHHGEYIEYNHQTHHEIHHGNVPGIFLESM